MARLKSREKFPPGGFKWYQPETNWRAPQFASFETVVSAVISHRLGNKYLAQKHHWATDYASVTEEVDAYNARLCEAQGWTDYIQGDGPHQAPVANPKLSPLSLAKSVRHVVVGAKTVVDMMGPEGPVDQDMANRRAAVCAPCPKNGKGGLLEYFTVKGAEAVRETIGFFHGLKLRTPTDEELGICQACGCPMLTKVWARLSHILAHMPQEDYNDLVPQCWIRSENHDSSQTSSTEDQRRLSADGPEQTPSTS